MLSVSVNLKTTAALGRQNVDGVDTKEFGAEVTAWSSN